ncbi:MAG: hypothetical protein L0I76_24185 [Pseudonocardia sp.]|nr:hypothetical protein [Pseudonocardia sp.]
MHDPDRLASLTLIEPAQVLSRFPATFLPVALGASRAAPEWLRRRARALLPDVRVEVVPGAGHSLSGERADLVNARVLDFTRRAGREGRHSIG